MTKYASFTWDEIFQTRARDPSVGRIAHPLSSLTKFFTRPIQNLPPQFPRFGNVAVIFYFQPSMVKGGMGHGFDPQMTIKAMLQCFTWERWHFSSVQFPSHPQRQETPGSNPSENFAQSKDDTIWSKSTWCWFRGCKMVTMRWARRQVSKEKRENRWSQTEIEKWARSQGCCSAGNLDDCEVVDIWKIYFEELGKVGSCVATNLIWWVGYQCCHSYLTSISGDGAEWIAWSWTRERIKSERASKPRRGEVWQLFGFLWFQYLITN